MNKPILCVDFDGVIHAYTTPWSGADVVSDGPVPGALPALKRLLNNFRVAIYSSRTSQPGGREAMIQAIGKWSIEQRESDHEDLAWLADLEFPEQKPAAFLTIDDRAMCFEGDWTSIDAADLIAFKPWNKRAPASSAA